MPDSPEKPAESLLTRLARALLPYEIFLVATTALALLVPGIWAYTLLDPWETHYGEVAREMLEDDDFVHLRWQGHTEASKPVLTFWLMAASLRALGIAEDGGYSGEMVSSDLVIFAIRLPFTLFAVLGLVFIWWMLVRLANRRVAYLATAVTVTTPFYFSIGRQGITDMPLVACIIGAIACFALAFSSEDEPPKPRALTNQRRHPVRSALGSLLAFRFGGGKVGRVVCSFLKPFRMPPAVGIFVVFLLLFVGGQAIYYCVYFVKSPVLAPGLRVPQPGLLLGASTLVTLLALLGWILFLQPVRTRRTLYLFWMYALVGVSVLAKGPVGPALVGSTCALTILLTGRLRFLLKAELIRGPLISAAIALPWHIAMWMKGGAYWINTYLGYHLGKRAFEGVHGERGAFDYFTSQIGIGLWPYVAFLPAALAAVVLAGRDQSREGQLRLIVGVWALSTTAFFSLVQTKFHHYIFPAIPPLAILVGFWLDDLLSGRVRKTGLVLVAGITILLLVCRDLIGEHEQLIELFIYRYDRPWPEIDLSAAFLSFSAAFTLCLGGLALVRLRRIALLGFLGTSVVFAVWTMHIYMGEAGPHWGQRSAHRTYYQLRQIHGVEVRYENLRDLADDWDTDEPYRVESVLPDDFRVGLPMRVTLHLPNAGVEGDKIILLGVVSQVKGDAFWITVTAKEREKLTDLRNRGRGLPRAPRSRWIQVDADRLIAWRLFWRGEEFWSSGEINGQTEDTRTTFGPDEPDKQLLDYLSGEGREGRRYFVLTEAGHAARLKEILPTSRAKQSYEVLDTSCNKFTLLSFRL